MAGQRTEGQAGTVIPVKIQVGDKTGELSLVLPHSLEGIFQKEPWPPAELLQWIVLEEGEEKAGERWLELLEEFLPQLGEKQAAEELTARTVETAFQGDGAAAARILLKNRSLACQVFASAAPPDFCLLVLEGCVEENRGKEAFLLLGAYRRSPLAERRENWQDMVEKLAVWAFREGRTGKALEGLTHLLPWERRQALGALAGRKEEIPVERRYPDPGYTGRVGEELMRILIGRRMDELGKDRPRRLGGLFLDLVLLRRPFSGPGETLPLLNGEGDSLGELPLERLPEHQRRMVRCMLAQGEEVFALLDGEISLASAGLWCAGLYWKRKGEREDG